MPSLQLDSCPCRTLQLVTFVISTKGKGEEESGEQGRVAVQTVTTE